ncbi:MAG: hypothetical protein ACD_79C00224G0001, partial [uncultured bacterium]
MQSLNSNILQWTTRLVFKYKPKFGEGLLNYMKEVSYRV